MSEIFDGLSNDMLEKQYEYKFGKIVLDVDFKDKNKLDEDFQKFVYFVLNGVNEFGKEGWMCISELKYSDLHNTFLNIVANNISNENRKQAMLRDVDEAISFGLDKQIEPLIYDIFLQREIKQVMKFNVPTFICDKCVNKNSCLNYNSKRFKCHNFVMYYSTGTGNGQNSNNFTVDKFGVDLNKKKTEE